MQKKIQQPSGFSDTEKWTRQQVIAVIQQESDTCLLSFSRGKDSLTAWIILREAGFRIVPFHCEIVPGLQFVEDSLQYYEDFFQTHIYRTIHPNCYYWLQTLAFQPPYRIQTVDQLDLPRFTYEDVQRGVARTVSLLQDTWTATGVRIVDSLNRRLVVQKYGPVDRKRRKFLPIYDMQKHEMIGILRKVGVKLPIDYQLFGRSFDGLDYRYLLPIKERLPGDYARILSWFPLAHLEFARAAIARRHRYVSY